MSDFPPVVREDVDTCDGDGNTLVHHAVLSGHMDALITFFGWKFDMNAKNNNHYTPLHLAIKLGLKSVVYILADRFGVPLPELTNDFLLSVKELFSDCRSSRRHLTCAARSQLKLALCKAATVCKHKREGIIPTYYIDEDINLVPTASAASIPKMDSVRLYRIASDSDEFKQLQEQVTEFPIMHLFAVENDYLQLKQAGDAMSLCEREIACKVVEDSFYHPVDAVSFIYNGPDSDNLSHRPETGYGLHLSSSPTFAFNAEHLKDGDGSWKINNGMACIIKCKIILPNCIDVPASTTSFEHLVVQADAQLGRTKHCAGFMSSVQHTMTNTHYCLFGTAQFGVPCVVPTHILFCDPEEFIQQMVDTSL